MFSAWSAWLSSGFSCNTQKHVLVNIQLVLLTKCTDEDLDLVTRHCTAEDGSNFTVDDVVTVIYLVLLLYFCYYSYSFSLLKRTDESFVPQFIYNPQHIQHCAVCVVIQQIKQERVICNSTLFKERHRHQRKDRIVTLNHWTWTRSECKGNHSSLSIHLAWTSVPKRTGETERSLMSQCKDGLLLAVVNR